MATFSPQEQQAFKYLFDLADTEQLGVLTGDKAVGFLSKSKLPIETLGEVWQASDQENNGFLTPQGFSLACRLIGHAQQGEAVSEDLINKPSQLPVFEGVTIPGAPASAAQPPSVVALAPVTTQDKTKFMRLFLGAGPANGLLDGDKARDIFIKSNLPFDQLGHIWNLADTKERGSLDATDFVIGMHLIDLTMSGQLPNGQLPDALPSGFYETAAVPASSSTTTTTTASNPPGSPVQQQLTGGGLQPQHSGSAAAGVPRGSILKPQSTGDRPLARQQTGQKVSFGPPAGMAASPPPAMASPGAAAFARPGAQQQQQQAPWDISNEEKARSDGFFEQLDARKTGFVEGDQAVSFFLESRLPEANLAQIWDLSDISKQGRLSKDEFAVAMRLINDQLDGKPVPSQLPLSLIPPSLRSGASALQAVPPSQQQSAGVERDLFSLMDEPEEIPAPAPASAAPTQALSPQITGTRSPAPQQVQPGLVPQGTGNRPTMLSPQTTGTHPTTTPAVSPPPPASAAAGDFFGDEAPKVEDNSVELGQLRNACNASTRGVSTLTTQREEMERSATASSSEVEELKEKLRVSRETFEAEQKLVQELSIKAGDHRKELQKAKQELITAESELSGLKVEKNEAEQSLMRDKEEIRQLKAKLADMNKETAGIKTDIAKLKKDGRQQKGMLAISKKQLATAEGDHEKATKELESLSLDPDASLPAAIPQGATAAAAAMPLPVSQAPSQVTSPAGSVRSTNPFDKFMTARPMSPQATGGSHNSKKSPLGQAAALPGSETDNSVPSTSGAAVAGAALAGTAGAAALGVGALGAHSSDAPPAAPDSEAQPATALTGDKTPENVATEDPFAPVDSARHSDDPFATGSPSSTAAPQAQAFDSAFDDNFDNSFAPPAPAAEPQSAAAATMQPTSAGFDDAFAGFDRPTAPAQEPHDEAPTTDRGGPPDSFMAQAADSDAGNESSADEDEGPEDLDGPSRSKTPQMPGAFGSEMEDTPSAPPPASSTSSAAAADVPTAPAPTAATVAGVSPKDGSNDFDSDFVDLAPSSTTGQGDDKFDDDDFNMDDFGGPSTTRSAGASTDDGFGLATSQPPQPRQASASGFDDAFGSDHFASSAATSSASAAGVPAITTSNNGGSAFDDFEQSFEPAPTQAAAAPPVASPALPSDSPAVQELTGMGFGRSAVADALKNNGNDRERALNALLDKAE